MLVGIKLSNSLNRLAIGQVSGIKIDLLQRDELLFLELDGARFVLNQPFLLLIDELALLLELCLQRFNGLLMHLALSFHRVTLPLLPGSDLVTLLLNLVLQNLLGAHHLEHAALRCRSRGDTHTLLEGHSSGVVARGDR